MGVGSCSLKLLFEMGRADVSVRGEWQRGMPSAGIALSKKPTVLLCRSHRALAVRAGTFERNEGVLLMIRRTHPEPGDPAAGNGILSRRIFLEGALVVGATGAGLSPADRPNRLRCSHG